MTGYSVYVEIVIKETLMEKKFYIILSCTYLAYGQR